eukprot:6612283-Ditylum_brightwellii.AAC.1
MIATNRDLQKEIKRDAIKQLKTFGVSTEMNGWVILVGEAANTKSKLRQSWQLTFGKAALYAKESTAAKHQPTTSTSEKETKCVVPMAMFTEEV